MPSTSSAPMPARPATYPGGPATPAGVLVLPGDVLPPSATAARPRPTTLDCGALLPLCDRRRLADYCSVLAEKTGRISRNVRGKLATWRQSMPHMPHNCPSRQRAAMHAFNDASAFVSRPSRRYVDPMMTSVAAGTDYHYRQQQQQGMLHSYGMNYEHGEHYEELASRRPTTSAYSRDIIRSLEELELNRIDQQPPPPPPPPLHHHSYQQLHREHRSRHQQPYNAYLSSSWSSERPYATLPKRAQRAASSCSFNLEEQFLPRDLQRLSRYPKSLQDLKYLEIEAILGRDPRPVATYPPREQHRFARREDLSTLDDRPFRSGSRASSSRQLREERRWMRQDEELAQDRLFLEGLAGGSQIERYEPGKVHYEREYRIYGKDTVALIFYKTCYL